MNKIYNKPELEIVLFDDADVIATSGAVENPTTRTLKTSINGKEGTDYGQQDVSIYD